MRKVYEVHYSDGADHEGIGLFHAMADAQSFVRALLGTKYTTKLVVIEVQGQAPARMVRATARAKAKG